MIPDFSEIELTTVRTLSQQRFKKEVDVHIADAELKLDENSSQLAERPTLFFQERGCNFVIFKTGFNEYRCQFFYDPTDQYGTGHKHYNDLTECVAALLQTQSDHERERQGISSGVTGKDLQ